MAFNINVLVEPMQRPLVRHPTNRFSAANLLCAFACLLLSVASAIADPPTRGGRFGQREREREKAEEDAKEKEKGNGPTEPTGGGPALRKAESALGSWLDRMEQFLPRRAVDFGLQDLAEFARETEGVEGWSAETARFDPPPTPEELGQIVNLLLDSKDRVDRALNRTLDLRTGLAALDKTTQHTAIRHFLRQLRA